MTEHRIDIDDDAPLAAATGALGASTGSRRTTSAVGYSVPRAETVDQALRPVPGIRVAAALDVLAGLDDHDSEGAWR